jgi:hypothetical protein
MADLRLRSLTLDNSRLSKLKAISQELDSEWRERYAVLLISAMAKEVDELTDEERIAIVLAAGGSFNLSVGVLDGQEYITLMIKDVGIVKVDGKFIVGQRMQPR